jgi:hypothetical protein
VLLQNLQVRIPGNLFCFLLLLEKRTLTQLSYDKVMQLLLTSRYILKNDISMLRNIIFS